MPYCSCGKADKVEGIIKCDGIGRIYNDGHQPPGVVLINYPGRNFFCETGGCPYSSGLGITGDTYGMPPGFVQKYCCENCYYSLTGRPRPAAKKEIIFTAPIKMVAEKPKCNCPMTKIMAEGCREHA